MAKTKTRKTATTRKPTKERMETPKPDPGPEVFEPEVWEKEMVLKLFFEFVCALNDLDTAVMDRSGERNCGMTLSWVRLLAFAKALGPDFEERVEAFANLDTLGSVLANCHFENAM